MLSLFSHLYSSYGSYRLCETYRVFSKKLKLQWPKLGHRNVYLYRSFHLEWVFLLTEVLRSPLNLHRQSFLESLFFLFPPVIAHEHMIGCFIARRFQQGIYAFIFGCVLVMARLCCKTKMEKTWMCPHESSRLNTIIRAYS